MREIAAMVLAAISLWLCGMSVATTWYVDASVPVSGDGTSWETAFKTIQDGIDASSDGDTVVAAEGVYPRARFTGTNLTLRSVDPCDPSVVAKTIIDGNEDHVPVVFNGTEDETCTLSGFTVRWGHGYYSAGGGITGYGTRATIRNNVIAGNRTWHCGGGLAYCDGVIENNVIRDNGAGKTVYIASLTCFRN